MQTILHENKHTLKLAFPIIVSHLSQMLLGLTDTLMVGQLGAVELAGVALMNILIHLVFVLGIGLAIAVSIQTSHQHGSGQAAESEATLFHGIFLSLLLGGLVWMGMQNSMPLLIRLKQPAEVLAIFPQYLKWIAPSMAFMMPIMIFKSYAEAQNRPWGVFWIQLAGVALNIGLNALLIFGYGGFPRMELEGAGMATLIARIFTLFALGIYIFRTTPQLSLKGRGIHRAECKSLLLLASPIAAQMLMEFGSFSASALLIGQLGSLPLAAHQIALTCATTTYMIPMGLANAVSIRVGHALGANAIDRARHIVAGAQGLTLLIMGIFAILYLNIGGKIAGAFNSDPELIALAAALLSIVGIFQLFDGIQVVSVGALRAMKDTKIPTLLCFIGYWLVSFPFGLWMGFKLQWGVKGFWMGLATGLTIAATSMSLRLIWLLRKRNEPSL
ncbi:MATE family efflux transporter [Kiritimatiellaeota bacterium B1221]|nr:MATE family efflux transporter [Kiritimatiellaeota bacterium B1221]